MVGQEELLELARLLRVSASTARLIAEAAPVDAERVRAVARQVEAMAAELAEIGLTVNVVPLLRPR